MYSRLRSLRRHPSHHLPHRPLSWLTILTLLSLCFVTAALSAPPTQAATLSSNNTPFSDFAPPPPNPSIKLQPVAVSTLPYVQVDAGYNHTCALKSDGSIDCWGSNYLGESSPPTDTFTYVSTGYYHTCGLKTVGSLACWGDSTYDKTTPPAGTFTKITAGYDHNCALRDDGTVACWGKNENDQATPPSGTFLDISAADTYTCGVRTEGNVVCWGTNSDETFSSDFTQVSTGEEDICGLRNDGRIECWGFYGNLPSATPSTFLNLTQITSGRLHACGLKSSGAVACWGANDEGQATTISGTFTQISAGEAHTCGIQSDGRVLCWGDDYFSKLPLEMHPQQLEYQAFYGTVGTAFIQGLSVYGGTGPYRFSAVGGTVPPGLTVSPAGLLSGTPTSGGIFEFNIAVSDTTNLAAQQHYRMEIAWSLTVNPPQLPGVNVGAPYSQSLSATGGTGPYTFSIGSGTLPPGLSLTPAGLLSGTPTTAGAYVFGIRADDATNLAGERRYTLLVGPVAQLSAGPYHTCELRSDGTVDCWGDDTSGESTPPASTFRFISVGEYDSCGIRNDNSMDCWGLSGLEWFGTNYSQVSLTRNNTDNLCILHPDGTLSCVGSDYYGESTPPSGYFTQVSVGDYHTCGLRTTGSVQCWGSNLDDQLLAPDDTFIQISARGNHTCGIKTDGTLSCWGEESYGVPTPPVGTFTQLSAGENLDCAVRSDGVVVCWQDTSSEEPQPDLRFSEVSVGVHHVCGLQTNGVVICWGSNYAGEAPSLVIEPSSLLNPEVGVPYSQTLTVTDLTNLYNDLAQHQPFSFSIVAGDLPPGLSLSTTGLLNGTPTTQGNYLFTVHVTSSLYFTATQTYTIDVVLPAFTYADPLGTCDGNLPCYPTWQQAVNLVADSGTVLIYPGTYNETLTLNKSTTSTLAGPVTITGDLTLAAGTLDVSSSNHSLTLTGNWNNTGAVFTPRTGTVNLTSSAAATLRSGAQPFHHLTLTGSGSWTLQDALDVNGDLTLAAGTLDASTSNHSLTLAGNWNRTGGTFLARAGTVTLDGTNQTINNTNTFYNLTKSGTTAATLTLPAGSDQTVQGALTWQGVSGGMLALRSSTPGTRWQLDAQGSRTLAYLDVQDSHNLNLTPMQPTGTRDSGNNKGWDFLPPADVRDSLGYEVAYDDWYGAQDASAIGGGYRASVTAGRRIQYRTPTTVTTLTIHTYKGPNQGKARVYLDTGEVNQVVDLYSPTPQWVTLVYTATPGNNFYLVQFTALGQKHAASQGYEVRFDAITAGTTADDSDLQMRYNNWTAGKRNPYNYGGSFRTSQITNATTSFTFTGTQVAWVFLKSPWHGIAEVSIDGTPVGLVDQYDPSTNNYTGPHTITYDGLLPGPHTITVRVTGTRHAASSNPAITSDGFRTP
jgi:alpha-tubulin suppressor-like RCC1 family protein